MRLDHVQFLQINWELVEARGKIADYAQFDQALWEAIHGHEYGVHQMQFSEGKWQSIEVMRGAIQDSTVRTPFLVRVIGRAHNFPHETKFDR